MIRRLLIFAALIALHSAATFGCSDPADAIAYGEICQPTTDDCSNTVELDRPDVGRNALDFDLRHTDSPESSSEAEVRLLITTSDDIDPPDSRDTDDDGRLILFDDTYAPASGDVIGEQLGSQTLTVASSLAIELECISGPCNHRLEYMFFSDAIECIDDDSCGRTEFCEQAYGRCAQCSDDDDCNDEQRCQRETGQCFPGETTGCQQSGGAPSTLLPLGIALALMGLVVWVGGHRRRRHRLGLVTLALPLMVAISMVQPTSAMADTGASMNVGAGARVLTGEAGELTTPGWGVNVNQQLRWRQFAALIELSTHSFGLQPERHPDDARLSGYGVTVGARGFFSLPISMPLVGDDQPFELLTGVDYTHWNVAQNRIASTTGLGLRYHAVGPTLGINWRWGGLAITMRANYSHIVNWPGGAVSLDVLIGIGP